MRRFYSRQGYLTCHNTVYKKEDIVRIKLVFGTVFAAVLSFTLIFNALAQKDKSSYTGATAQNTIEGVVRDIACPIQNKEATAMAFNLKCALECARQGSPLIILTKDGDIYIPISDSMPDQDQRARLMPFVGKYVKATGKTYERNGTRAIVIAQITEMKDVHPVTDAQ
jgi:hypothetical protein